MTDIEKDKLYHEHMSFSDVSIPATLWEVEIPKGGNFKTFHTKEISWWARMWMRFIGWGVTDVRPKRRHGRTIGGVYRD